MAAKKSIGIPLTTALASFISVPQLSFPVIDSRLVIFSQREFILRKVAFAQMVLGTVASAIVPVLERVFRFQFLDSEVYYSSDIPSELHVHDVVWISIVALVLTLASTIYPAVRASRTPPADALRYE